MNIKELATHVAKLEGKKHQASIGDVREIIGILSDALIRPDSIRTYMALVKNGQRRAKRKKR
jgi:hypothetical protein